MATALGRSRAPSRAKPRAMRTATDMTLLPRQVREVRPWDHLPFAERALRRSVVELIQVGVRPLPAFEEATPACCPHPRRASRA